VDLGDIIWPMALAKLFVWLKPYFFWGYYFTHALKGMAIEN
jgi:hypothetical protein